VSRATAPPARWENYCLERGEGLSHFWQFHLGETDRKVLVVLGRGFDPRMCLGTELLMRAGGTGTRDVMLIHYKEGEDSPSRAYDSQVEDNCVRLNNAIGARGSITLHEIECFSAERRRIGPRGVQKLFDARTPMEGYTDVVVDVSSLPRGLYFPLIVRLLYHLDEWTDGTAPNLHVMVAEDPELDAYIEEKGVDERAEFLPSFSYAFNREATTYPTVWLPMLGEKCQTQLERLYDEIKPDETAPVLPSPARQPRRGDTLLMSYREFLFDQLRIDPRNILYVSEQNPFEAYRQIRKSILYFQEVLGLLGGCRFALSALSSKLMSLGALLVAYELKNARYDIGVAHIDCQGYEMISTTSNPEIVGLWLSGECDAQ
jgi:hypothetical protein